MTHEAMKPRNPSDYGGVFFDNDNCVASTQIDLQDLGQVVEAALQSLPDYRGTIDVTASRNRAGVYSCKLPDAPGLYILRVTVGVDGEVECPNLDGTVDRYPCRSIPFDEP